MLFKGPAILAWRCAPAHEELPMVAQIPDQASTAVSDWPSQTKVHELAQAPPKTALSVTLADIENNGITRATAWPPRTTTISSSRFAGSKSWAEDRLVTSTVFTAAQSKFIDIKNCALLGTFSSRPLSNSTASTGFMSLSTRRRR